MDIKKVWKVFKMSSMGDMDIQRAFQRAATVNACIELLEENEKLEKAIRETINLLDVEYVMGIWVVNSPSERKYPFEIAAKMVRDIKCVTHEEAGQMVTDTTYFYDLCNDQTAIIHDLKKELVIAELTVKLLQVEDS